MSAAPGHTGRLVGSEQYLARELSSTFPSSQTVIRQIVRTGAHIREGMAIELLGCQLACVCIVIPVGAHHNPGQEKTTHIF